MNGTVLVNRQSDRFIACGVKTSTHNPFIGMDLKSSRMNLICCRPRNYISRGSSWLQQCCRFINQGGPTNNLSEKTFRACAGLVVPDKYGRSSGVKDLRIVGSPTARVLGTAEFFHHAPKIPLISPIFVSYNCPDSENKQLFE